MAVSTPRQAVILAAGEGTRMRPLSASMAKPMLPVAGQPLAAHAARAAAAAGAEELVFVVGYRADDVRTYFGEAFAGVPVSYASQPEQAGTADAVQSAREFIDGPFAVLNGDNLYDPASIASLFSSTPAVGVHQVDDPTSYGVLSTDGETATDIVEKPTDPPSDLANTGAYAFPEEALEWLDVPASQRGEHEITDVVARVIREFDVRVVELDRWLDIGRPWELLEANELLLDTLERDLRGDVHPDADIRGPVVVEEGAHVDAGVVVEGPSLIRSGAHIGPNAYVRAKTLVGPDAHVGHGVEVKNSVLMDSASVGHLSYVGDSVLGPDVNFGAGTTVANLRHDDRPVRMTVKGERVSTNRRKFGVVAGEGAKTGINTSINAGVVLGSNTSTAPGEALLRDRR